MSLSWNGDLYPSYLLWKIVYISWILFGIWLKITIHNISQQLNWFECSIYIVAAFQVVSNVLQLWHTLNQYNKNYYKIQLYSCGCFLFFHFVFKKRHIVSDVSIPSSLPLLKTKSLYILFFIYLYKAVELTPFYHKYCNIVCHIFCNLHC